MNITPDRAFRLLMTSASFVQVFYEAVANAFDACADKIAITINFAGKLTEPVISVLVVDNGRGFRSDDYRRFRDLEDPKDEFHKGLGRLVYLKYFASVGVDSASEAGRMQFTFSTSLKGAGKPKESAAEAGSRTGTILSFESFVGDRIHSSDDLRPDGVKAKLREHFFPLLYKRCESDEPFEIRIRLNTAEENNQTTLVNNEVTLTAADIPELQTKTVTLDLFNAIKISYRVEADVGKGGSGFTAAVVDGRTIDLGLLPPNSLPLNASAVFLFESDTFIGKADSARQKLVLPDGMSIDELMSVLRREIAVVLQDALPEISKRNERLRADLEHKYPHLAGLFDTKAVGLSTREDVLQAAQAQFFADQRKVLEATHLDDALFAKSLEVSARLLTEYILYRNFTIDRLGAFSDQDAEAAIHDLIVPRYETFEAEGLVDHLFRNNAWLLDDKFMTFREILSEARMDQVIDAISGSDELASDLSRPDISMIFTADPDVANRVDVVVVELKKRDVDDKEGLYAVTQLVSRAQKLVTHCPNIERVWYYGVIEIDDALGQTLENLNWIPLSSKGRVYYQELSARSPTGATVPAPTILLSFESLIADARARNHTFLELLKAGFAADAEQ